MNLKYMKKIYIILVVIVFVGIISFSFYSNDAEVYDKPILDTVSVKVSYQLKNNIGRTLSNVNVKSYLPIFAVQHSDSEELNLTHSSNGIFFDEFQIEKIEADQVIKFNKNYLVNLTEDESDASSAVIYQNNLNDKEKLTFLENEFKNSSGVNEFISANPQLDSLLFLANKLSKSKPIRIISGVDKDRVVEQIPKCWLQEYRDDKWQTIGVNQKNILSFKVIGTENQITESVCSGLVEAWALDITEYKVILQSKA